MKIKKIGHCCLLIKLDNLTILTDPGAFSTSQNKVTGIEIFSHHADLHLFVSVILYTFCHVHPLTE